MHRIVFRSGKKLEMIILFIISCFFLSLSVQKNNASSITMQPIDTEFERDGANHAIYSLGNHLDYTAELIKTFLC